MRWLVALAALSSISLGSAAFLSLRALGLDVAQCLGAGGMVATGVLALILAVTVDAEG